MSRLAELLYGLRHPGGQTRGFYHVRAQRTPDYLNPLADARDELLAAREDEEALTRHAKAGDTYAAALLPAMLYDGGDEDGLARHAKAGNGQAARALADRLVDRGDREGLTRRADAGSWSAANRLAALLAARGDRESLTRRADAGDDCAAYQLIELRGVTTIDEL